MIESLFRRLAVQCARCKRTVDEVTLNEDIRETNAFDVTFHCAHGTKGPQMKRDHETTRLVIHPYDISKTDWPRVAFRLSWARHGEMSAAARRERRQRCGGRR